ncbi:MAG: pentapeptide repeat-containing protein [Lentisphaerae bacterium]|nr:pentapeptide repeat-containing protein [Lentisphaerota bacterium]
MSSEVQGKGGRCWQILLTVFVDRRVRRLLTRPGGVEAWNRMVGRLYRGLLNAVWKAGSEPPPLVMAIRCDEFVFSGMKLDGVSLEHCQLSRVDFSRCSLRGARFGSLDHCDFHQADLTDADFSSADISGCDFDQAIIDDTTVFNGAIYDRNNAPRSLACVNDCRPMDWSVPTAGRQGHSPDLPWVPLRASIVLLDLGSLGVGAIVRGDAVPQNGGFDL